MKTCVNQILKALSYAATLLGAGFMLPAFGQDYGYTLMLTTSALSMNAALKLSLPFKVTTDFAPVALLAWAPSVLVVNPALGVKSVQELIALAKSKPGKLSYASAGEGTPAHLSAELFKSMMGVSLLHVPYKGAPQAMTDLVSGQVDLLFANAAVALPQIKSGRVMALAVTSAQRFAALPELPTLLEAGVTNFEADQWLAYLKQDLEKWSGVVKSANIKPE